MADGDPEERPKLTPPYYPSGDSEGIPYIIQTAEAKAVAEYARISLFDAFALDIFRYWALLRDAIIYNRAQSEAGRKWLRDAHRLTQTEPDMEGLQAFIEKGGG